MHIAMIAVVGQVGIRILARDIAHRERQPTHKLIDVVKTECPPGVILSGLDDDIGILESSTEEGLDEASPVFLLACVGCAHIINVDVSNILLLLPLITSGHHLLNARAVHPVDATEDTDIGQLTSFLWRDPLLDKLLLCGDRASSDIVLLIFLAERSD